jgi:hypothetical protein
MHNDANAAASHVSELLLGQTRRTSVTKRSPEPSRITCFEDCCQLSCTCHQLPQIQLHKLLSCCQILPPVQVRTRQIACMCSRRSGTHRKHDISLADSLARTPTHTTALAAQHVSHRMTTMHQPALGGHSTRIVHAYSDKAWLGLSSMRNPDSSHWYDVSQ